MYPRSTTDVTRTYPLHSEGYPRSCTRVCAATEDSFADVKHVLEIGEIAPPAIQLLSAFDADACSDTNGGDSDPDLQDGASISANAYQNRSVSAHEAISFLDNVLFPFEELGLSLPSPNLASPQPTPQSFDGSHPLPLSMADYQDAVFDTLTPLDTHSYMGLAMGDEAVHSDSFVVYPFLDLAPTQECFPGHHLLPLVMSAYQDTDSGAPARRIIIMGDEAKHPAGFVAFPTTTAPSDSFSDNHSYDYMEDVESISQIPCFPTSFWTYRESVQMPDNDNDLFGLRCMSYNNMELCEADDMAMAEDPTVDLLTSRFASSLRLDVDFCAKCSTRSFLPMLCRHYCTLQSLLSSLASSLLMPATQSAPAPTIRPFVGSAISARLTDDLASSAATADGCRQRLLAGRVTDAGTV